MVRRVCCSGLLGCLLAACFSLALASTALSAPFAYVANVEGGSISQYALSRVGLLGSLMPPTVPAGDRPSAIAFSPDGRSVYVTDLAGEIRQFDVADRLWRVDVPTLVLAGSKDAIVPASRQQRLAQRISGARFATLEGAGHVGFVTHADAFVRQVRDHFQRVKASA